MHFRTLVAGLSLLISAAVPAAGDALPWDKSFGGEKSDAFVSVTALPDGGYVTAGMTESKGAGGQDFWVMRFDAKGSVLWDRTFGGPQDDAPIQRPLVALSDGGFAFAGKTGSKGAGEDDAWVVRLSANGDVIWDKTFGGAGSDFATSLAAMPDGGLAVVGKSFSPGDSEAVEDWVLRLDGDGRLLWEKKFPSQLTPRGVFPSLATIAALADGGLVLAGETKAKESEDADAWFVRLDAKGDVVWDKTYNGPQDERPSSIVVLPDGFAAAGGAKAGKIESGQAWRLDQDGRLLWQKSFGNPRGSVFATKALPDGGLALAGVIATSVGGENGASVWRLDPDGRLLWQQLIDAPNPGVAMGIDVLPDGRLIVGGVTFKNGSMAAAIVILPQTPPAATEKQEAAASAPADEKCMKYVPSVGKTVAVPCERVPSPAPPVDEHARAPTQLPAVAMLPPPAASKPEPARPSPSLAATTSERLAIKLHRGTVSIHLRPDLAPKHVERIKQLAKDGFYDGSKFHRVIPGFMAQTGDPSGTGSGGSKYPDLAAEFSQEPFKRGTVGAAREADPNSANSQFFICYSDTACGGLTGQYTVLGEVVEGMELVDQLAVGEPPTHPDVMRKASVDTRIGE